MPVTETHPVRVEDVFTPDDNPTYTYVSRSDDKSEATLKEITRSSHFVVSISGPSKCGKTVTVRRIFGDDLIEVSGSNIVHASDLWDRVLDWMEVPATKTRATTGQIGAGGGLNLGLFAARADVSSTDAATETYHRGGVNEVIKR